MSGICMHVRTYVLLCCKNNNYRQCTMYMHMQVHVCMCLASSVQEVVKADGTSECAIHNFWVIM